VPLTLCLGEVVGRSGLLRARTSMLLAERRRRVDTADSRPLLLVLRVLRMLRVLCTLMSSASRLLELRRILPSVRPRSSTGLHPMGWAATQG